MVWQKAYHLTCVHKTSFIAHCHYKYVIFLPKTMCNLRFSNCILLTEKESVLVSINVQSSVDPIVPNNCSTCINEIKSVATNSDTVFSFLCLVVFAVVF